MRIRIKKLQEVENPRHPNNIEVGFEKVFESKPDFQFHEPHLSMRFYPCSWWSTSVVTQIIDEKTFRTLNSIYEWEVIK